MLARRVSTLLLGLTLVLGARGASAAPSTPPPSDSWAGQLEGLSQWLEAHKTASECTEHCFTLDRLTLRGSLADGTVRFEMTGGVLAQSPVAVPLFGPPSQVRLEEVTEDGHPAAVGFDDTGYFVFTSAKRFTVRGKLTLGADLALHIPGPLNALDAELGGGHVVEGAHLAGLKGTTIHFDRSTGATEAAEPTVFQLSRAVRVGRTTDFEYRLVMRSGNDLGVARLPLAYGEKVLDVTGSNGWRVDGTDLVLPTAGHTAEITVRGTLPSLAKVTSFAPDGRSTFEWWLIESDPEHRIVVKGDAGQVDAAQSPIPRTQTSARLYLAQRGQHVEVSVETLTSAEILAAVVRSEHRDIVLTRSGDLVSDDTLTYENNGIDYLDYDPNGRAIYLALDGKADRIMHDDASHDVLVPLSSGSHTVRVQSLTQTAIELLGGRLAVPVPHHTLTRSASSVTLGLPRRVHPLAVMGGDRTEWFVHEEDVVAVLVAAAVGFLTMKKRSRRIAASLALAGTWFVSSPLFVAAVSLVASAYTLSLASRLLRGRARSLALAGLGACALVLGLAFTASFASRREETASVASKMQSVENNVDMIAQAQQNTRYGVRGPSGDVALDDKAKDERRDGDSPNQAHGLLRGALLEGVTPVALTLPSYERSVTVSRELVTKDRPFSPVLYYVTDWAMLPFLGIWLLACAFLLRSHRAELALLRERIRERLAKRPEPVTPAPLGETPAE